MGHLARVGERSVYSIFWWEELTNKDHIEDVGADEKIILKLMFKWIELEGRRELDWSGSCEQGNEPLGSTKCNGIQWLNTLLVLRSSVNIIGVKIHISSICTWKQIQQSTKLLLLCVHIVSANGWITHRTLATATQSNASQSELAVCSKKHILHVRGTEAAMWLARKLCVYVITVTSTEVVMIMSTPFAASVAWCRVAFNCTVPEVLATNRTWHLTELMQSNRCKQWRS